MSCRMRPLDFFSTSPFPRLKSSRSCRGVRNCFRDFLGLIWWLFKPMGTYSNSALRCSGYSVLKAKSRKSQWTPVVYINRSIERAELAALYKLADVCWVGSLRDGMNLVAKEYVACKAEGDGVLVLSEFAGAAAEMGEALLINPFDEERTASTVERALALDEDERRQRMKTLHARVLRNNVFRWGDRFLRCKKLFRSAGVMLTRNRNGSARRKP